jgi:hypothetical protein
MPDPVLRAQGATGSTCRQSGPYRSSRNARVVLFVKQGAAFPRDADGASTTWVLMTLE